MGARGAENDGGLDGRDQPCRVLLVDDSPDLRLLLRVLLDGYEEFKVVGEAVDGLEAIALAAELVPTVILLDVSSPLLENLSAVDYLHEVSPHSAIVAVSSLPGGAPDDPRMAEVDDWIPKNLPQEALVHSLRSAVNHHADH